MDPNETTRLPEGFEWHKQQYDCPINGPRWCWVVKTKINVYPSRDERLQAERCADLRNERELGASRPTSKEYTHSEKLVIEKLIDEVSSMLCLTSPSDYWQRRTIEFLRGKITDSPT